MAIISTGNELIAPGEPMRPPHVFDSNAQILADAVRELGGLPRSWGIVRDDADALRQMLHAALAESDVVLLSGGTSKGQGDLCYRVVAELTDPGHRRAWRGAEAGQADLPGGQRRQAGRHSAGLSDVGDFYVSRIRRAGDSPAGRATSRVARTRSARWR